MNVANLELCKELYELSGWIEGTEKYWWRTGKLLNKPLKLNGYNYDGRYPAYDLGYLLRKTSMTELESNPRLECLEDGTWHCVIYLRDSAYQRIADSPENAIAELAIELIKAGVLAVRRTHKDTNLVSEGEIQ